MVLQHSLQLQPGKRVLIDFTATGADFADVVGEEVIKAGGYPVFSFTSERVSGCRLAFGTPDQLMYVHPSEVAQTDCDAAVIIEAPTGYHRPWHSAAAAALRWEATAYYRNSVERLPWAVVAIPTEHLARTMAMSSGDCQDLLMAACLDVNWQRLQAEAQRIQALFHGCSEVRVVAPGTDLRFALVGPGAVGAGRQNLPDGELYYAPVASSVCGHLTLPHPQSWLGSTITGMSLDFHRGGVSRITAATGADVLRQVLDTDPGAKFLGEFGIGLNPAISTITGSSLLDEKIAGTIHLALGSAYPACGGKNQSQIHWDLVLDLRTGGEVQVDGQTVCRDGIWLCPEEPSSQLAKEATCA
jgi:aminopeptidase